MSIRVWGRINGMKFDQVFSSVAEWRAERAWIERIMRVDVHGMASVEASAWASLQMQPVKHMLNHITPNVLRVYPAGAPKALVVVQRDPESMVQ